MRKCHLSLATGQMLRGAEQNGRRKKKGKKVFGFKWNAELGKPGCCLFIFTSVVQGNWQSYFGRLRYGYRMPSIRPLMELPTRYRFLATPIATKPAFLENLQFWQNTYFNPFGSYTKILKKKSYCWLTCSWTRPLGNEQVDVFEAVAVAVEIHENLQERNSKW